MSPLIIAALVLAAPAPTEDFGAARAKVLAPYIDEQTQAIVRLDQTLLFSLRENAIAKEPGSS